MSVGTLTAAVMTVMASEAQRPISCRIAGSAVAVRDLPEGSGVAASRARPGVLWAHNDSGEPRLIALNESGTVIGQPRVVGAQVDDWEDLAVAPCPQGSCIYVGDIGDNRGRRADITVYRVAEPSETDTRTQAADVFRARYPDGAHDAESLIVTAEPDIFIITKGDPGPVALYRFPRPLTSGAIGTLERVGTLARERVDAGDRPTAADLSANGEFIAVRTTRYLTIHAAKAFLRGQWQELSRLDLTPLKEPRGEGLAFGRAGSMFLVGESGGVGSGTFARVACQ
jgi:hypothetical protein